MAKRRRSSATTSVMVGADTTTTPPDTTTPGAVSRLLPAGPVSPDDELTVTINNVGLGAAGGIGQVIETLPAGFSYVDGFCYEHVSANGGIRGGYQC